MKGLHIEGVQYRVRLLLAGLLISLLACGDSSHEHEGTQYRLIPASSSSGSDGSIVVEIEESSPTPKVEGESLSGTFDLVPDSPEPLAAELFKIQKVDLRSPLHVVKGASGGLAFFFQDGSPRYTIEMPVNLDGRDLQLSGSGVAGPRVLPGPRFRGLTMTGSENGRLIVVSLFADPDPPSQ